MSSIAENLRIVRNRIRDAARAAGRDPSEVALLAVSKTFGAAEVIETAQAGQRVFGESYSQEALAKIESVRSFRPDLRLQWHFIGPVQSNKTRVIATHFDWVHSVDRVGIAERLAAQRPDHMPPLNICLQINVSGESTKSGVSPREAAELARAIARIPRLALRGLMAIPKPSPRFDKQRLRFRQVREIFDVLREDGLALDTLSMGMSADMDAAVAEGASIVRVGSAIFGQRRHSYSLHSPGILACMSP
jgi:pyridoxal phosphate enzyme (YggS family)